MKIADGVYVHFIPTQKYKTNRIVFRMTGSLNKQTIAKRALVSQMLATANQTYPTVQSFKERLASLYGTQLSTKVSTKGLTHAIENSFFLPFLNIPPYDIQDPDRLFFVYITYTIMHYLQIYNTYSSACKLFKCEQTQVRSHCMFSYFSFGSGN